jgi:hypothetical protein
MLVGVVVCLPATSFAATTVDTTPGERLGGYVGQASAMAFSFQPVLPALLPTGDAPFEATIGLSTADLKSGGNAYGHASLLWPGSAAADPGPLIAQGAHQPSIGALFPKWSLQAEARQGDGVVTTGAPPAIVMNATGFPDQAAGDDRIADLDVPGLAHIEHIASTANAAVSDSMLTTTSRVVLHGISLLNGAITVDQVQSISKTTSDGITGTAKGHTVVSGLKIGGFSVTVTDRGFQVVGAPPGSEQAPGAGGKPFPDASPGEQVQQVLDSLHARLTLFRSVGRTVAGSADQSSTGFVLSVDNPIGGVGPIPPGHFDVILASTSAKSLASPPFVVTLPSLPSGGGLGSAPGPGSVSIGSGASVSPQALVNAGGPASSLGGPSLAGAPVANLNATTQRGRYEFGGVPMGLVIGLLIAAAIAARYVRSALLALMSTKE